MNRADIKHTALQLLRYILSGGLAMIVGKSLFLLLCSLIGTGGAGIYIATTTGYAAGLVITYLLSICWVFDERRISSRRVELLIFIGIGLVGTLLMNLITYLLGRYTALPTLAPVRLGRTEIAISAQLIINLLATVLVTLWNFLAKKIILFSKPKSRR